MMQHTRTYTRAWDEPPSHSPSGPISQLSSPVPRRRSAVDVADTLARRGHALPKLPHTGTRSSARSRSPRAHSSGWAARRRARTRPVRVIARRHARAHNRTVTPFARESALPTIARDTRYTTGRERPDHARHCAQLTEKCGRERRPMATRAVPPSTPKSQGLPGKTACRRRGFFKFAHFGVGRENKGLKECCDCLDSSRVVNN